MKHTVMLSDAGFIKQELEPEPDPEKKNKKVGVRLLIIIYCRVFIVFVTVNYIAVEMYYGFSNIQKVDVDDEAPTHEEPVRPLKRLRLRGQDGQPSRLLSNGGPSSAAFPLKTPKSQPGTVSGSSSRLQPQSTSVLSNGNGVVDKGKKPLSPEDTLRGRRSISDRNPPPVVFKEPGTSPLSKSKTPHSYPFITPKPEPFDEEPDYLAPISMILPGN
jgi:hypothetical protein